MKVEFGCGKKLKPGWVGVDIRPIPGVKHNCNFWEVQIEPNTVQQIFCRHALEHVTYANAARTFKKFYEILKSGGIADIIVPDIEWHARQLLGKVKGNGKFDDLEHALAGLYGWQDGGEESIHRSGWTRPLLNKYLREAGFADIQINAYHAGHIDLRARK